MKRRRFLQVSAGAAMGSLGGQALASEAPAAPLLKGKAEHGIFFWLGGGMAQIDTFDPKKLGDAEKNVPGSYYPAIDTVVPGVQLCEHLPRVAKIMDRLTAVRTCYHEVIDEHAAAVNRVHTGRPVSGTVQYPSLGSVVSHELGPAGEGVPGYVMIGYPSATKGPGFLGPKAGYVYLTDTESGPAGLARPDWLSTTRRERREILLGKLRASARRRHDGSVAFKEYDDAVEESLRLSGPDFMRVFNLEEEKASLRESYGSEFGQRCLLSRRLVESGVRFVEVSHNLNFKNGTGWDTHQDGQLNQHLLIEELDHALSGLVLDLEARKMLDRVLIVIGTEFGRPAAFDAKGGRGHHSKAFTMVLGGGGLQHAGAYGETDEIGQLPVRDAVSLPDFHATAHAALGIDYTKELHDGDRPVPITDGGKPISSLFA